MKNLIIILIAMMFIFTSCNLNYYPSDAMNSAQLQSDSTSLVYATDGNYSMFKDILPYKGISYSGNTYIRHYTEMTEFQSDNICLSGRTTDPLYQATVYEQDATLGNVTYLWWVAYHVIYGANAVIESIKDGSSNATDHLKGENYFLRAFCTLNLVTLWAKPYALGRDNLGVPLRTSTDATVTKRATVGECYDQIVSDLLDAIRLMSHSTRGNAGYASEAAAQGLLSRVYLYMGENQNVVDLVNQMLNGADPSSELEPSATFPSYFANALTSKETLWAVAKTPLESLGQEDIASMYLNDGVGWGEVYASDPLLDLYNRYPNDLRLKFIRPVYADTTKWMIRWPISTPGVNFESNQIQIVTKDPSTGLFYYTNNSNNIYVQTELQNGYPVNYIVQNGVKTYVHLSKQMALRNTFPLFYVLKFSYQNGDPMLSSPVMIRWAEVILNRAEAYAKLGMNAEALADVNVIRTRAGLSGDELFSLSNMHGYQNVLDVVLDERRMELAFEGQRAFDVYRNELSLNREYAGVQPWEIINYTDNKIQYLIPEDEITVSGIQQNP
jgi:hypothetical protein